MSREHRRRYQLGFGVSVEFVFRPAEVRQGEVNLTAVVCEWDPAIPQFPPGNHRNKFLRKYRAARDDFYQDMAQLTGENMLNVDIDEHGLGAMTAFKPPVPS